MHGIIPHNVFLAMPLPIYIALTVVLYHLRSRVCTKRFCATLLGGNLSPDLLGALFIMAGKGLNKLEIEYFCFYVFSMTKFQDKFTPTDT